MFFLGGQFSLPFPLLEAKPIQGVTPRAGRPTQVFGGVGAFITGDNNKKTCKLHDVFLIWSVSKGMDVERTFC